MLRYTPDVDWDEVKKVPGRRGGGGRHLGRRRRRRAAAPHRGGRGHPARAVDQRPLRGHGRGPGAARPVARQGPGAPPTRRPWPRRSSGWRACAPAAPPTWARCSTRRSARCTAPTSPRWSTSATAAPRWASCDGDALAERLTRSVAGSSARLFTIAVGAQANHSLLQRLARIGGGRSVPRGPAGAGGAGGAALRRQPQDADHHRPQARRRRRPRPGVLLGGGQGVARPGGDAARAHPPRAARRGEGLGQLRRQAVQQDATSSAPKSGRDYSYVPTLWARRYLQQPDGRRPPEEPRRDHPPRDRLRADDAVHLVPGARERGPVPAAWASSAACATRFGGWCRRPR